MLPAMVAGAWRVTALGLVGLVGLVLGACQAGAEPGVSGSESEASGDASESGGETGDETGGIDGFRCAPERPHPYPSPMSYVGVHAGPGNDDLVDCELGSAWTEAWHALEGYAIAQPNTFSPDGRTTYVTTSQPSGDACTVWALDVETGEPRWCVAVPGALEATLEVDADGNVYTTADAAVLSWTADGAERWATAIPGDDPERNATGLHFTSTGDAATVTDAGVVMLVDRGDGSVVAQLDLPAELGLVPAVGGTLTIDFDTLLPPAVVDDFADLHGPGGIGGALGKFAGASGNFSDNTIAVAPTGELYVIGGGLDEDHGAVVQLRVREVDGVTVLEPGWLIELVGGSASSPAISPDGAWLKVSDGNTLSGFLEPSGAEASARIVDIKACDANLDDDPDPDRCAPARIEALLTGPALGASPVYAGGEAWRWEVQFAALYGQTAPDLVQSFPGRPGLEVFLPDDRVWSSVLTLTRNRVLGTMTALTASDTQLLTVTLPRTAESELVVLDRGDGGIVYRAPISDDSTSTVTVGPDGSVYVTMLGLLHTLATETRPVGGLVRFSPE